MARTQTGSRVKLRTHFLENIGKVMTSDELREVAGTSEWARRVRELRDEEGYQILTNHDRAELKIGEYLLENDKPQPAFERSISKETRAYVLDRNGFTCQMCGAVAGETHQKSSGYSFMASVARYYSISILMMVLIKVGKPPALPG